MPRGVRQWWTHVEGFEQPLTAVYLRTALKSIFTLLENPMNRVKQARIRADHCHQPPFTDLRSFSARRTCDHWESCRSDDRRCRQPPPPPTATAAADGRRRRQRPPPPPTATVAAHGSRRRPRPPQPPAAAAAANLPIAAVGSSQGIDPLRTFPSLRPFSLRSPGGVHSVVACGRTICTR